MTAGRNTEQRAKFGNRLRAISGAILKAAFPHEIRRRRSCRATRDTQATSATRRRQHRAQIRRHSRVFTVDRPGGGAGRGRGLSIGVFHRPATGYRARTLPAEHDHRTLRRPEPCHRTVCAAAARHRQVRRLSQSAARRHHLHRRQGLRKPLGGGRVARVWCGLSRRRDRGPGAGRFHAHHAAVAQPVSFARPQLPAQDPGGPAGHPDRAALHQAANLHPLCQPDLSRPWRLRLRGGRELLLRQEGQGPDYRRSGRARGPAQGAECVLAHQQSRARAAPAEPGDQQHAGGRQDHRRRGATRRRTRRYG